MTTAQVLHAQTVFEKKTFAKQALKNQLFVSGWMLENELDLLQRGQSVDFVEICIAIKSDTPVGVALYYIPNASRGCFSIFPDKATICFVLATHRNEGIGRKLVQGFGVMLSDMNAWLGEVGSDTFWKNVGVEYKGVFLPS